MNSRTAVIAGMLGVGLVVGGAGVAKATPVEGGGTSAANAATASHTAASPIEVATRAWQLGPLGSGEAVLQCPAGYGVQFDETGAPNFGSSNLVISVTPAGYSDSAVTLWVTNWMSLSEITTLHIWCDPN